MPNTATLTTATVTARALSIFEKATVPTGPLATVAPGPALGGAPARFGLPPTTRLEGAGIFGAKGGFGDIAEPGAAATGATEAVDAPELVWLLNVGSLIVGEAIGLGGKLMRTVSFFG